MWKGVFLVFLFSLLWLRAWGAEPDSTSVVALLNQSSQLYNQNLDSALLLAKQAEREAREVGDTLLWMRTLTMVGSVQMQRARYDDSFLAYERVIQLALASGDSLRAAGGLHNQGKGFEWQYRLPLALETYHRALRILPPRPHFPLHGTLLNSLGNAHNMLGNLDSAEYYYQQSILIRRELGNVVNEAFVVHDWALLKIQREEYDTAMQMIHYARQQFVEGKLYWANAQASHSLGLVHYALGNLDSTEYWLQGAFDSAYAMGNLNSAMTTARTLENLFQTTGDFKKASQYQDSIITFQDSLYRERFQNEIDRLRSQLELEEQQRVNAELEQNQLEQEARFQRQRFWLAMVGLLVLALASVIIGQVRGRRRQVRFNLQLQAKNQEIQRQNQDIQDSLAYAQHLQRALLPAPERLAKVLPRHMLFFRPLGYVSGDVYWEATLPDGAVVVAVIDCTGHGAPGAMLSVLAINGLQEAIQQRGVSEPHEILAALQGFLTRSLQQQTQDGLEVALVKFYPERRQLSFAGAGRSLVYMQRHQLHQIRGERYGLRGDPPEGVTWTTHRVAGVDSNDTFYLCSDGFEDQFGGAEGKKYYPKRLRSWMYEHYREPMDQQAKLLQQEFDAWKGDLPQVDDVLVLGFKPWEP